MTDDQTNACTCMPQVRDAQHFFELEPIEGTDARAIFTVFCRSCGKILYYGTEKIDSVEMF